VISFAWGGCGNLVKHCLTSNIGIIDFYKNMDVNVSWTDQEWQVRDSEYYTLSHHYARTAKVKIAWRDSLDCSFHYLIKNITLNHLTGDIGKRTRAVIDFNSRLEHRIRQDTDCVYVENFLIQPRFADIVNAWKKATYLYFSLNASLAQQYFKSIGVDYNIQNFYNIVYENTIT